MAHTLDDYLFELQALVNTGAGEKLDAADRKIVAKRLKQAGMKGGGDRQFWAGEAISYILDEAKETLPRDEFLKLNAEAESFR